MRNLKSHVSRVGVSWFVAVRPLLGNRVPIVVAKQGPTATGGRSRRRSRRGNRIGYACASLSVADIFFSTFRKKESSVEPAIHNDTSAKPDHKLDVLMSK